MNKERFLNDLESGMSEFSEQERKESRAYYDEIIEDKIESGMTEEEAVKSLGGVDEIIRNMKLDRPFPTLIAERVKRKGELSGGEVMLIIFGVVLFSPVILSLIATALSVYASIWAAVFAFYAMAVSFVAVAIGMFFGIFVMLFTGSLAKAFFLLGLSLVFIGISILLILSMNVVRKSLAEVSVKYVRWLKSILIRKER